MRRTVCLLFLLAPLVHAQGTVMLAGGGSEGDIGDTNAWSYGLYAALVENGDVDGDRTVRVAVVSRLSETDFIPNYFERIGQLLGVTVDAFNVRVASQTEADNPATVGRQERVGRRPPNRLARASRTSKAGETGRARRQRSKGHRPRSPLRLISECGC